MIFNVFYFASSEIINPHQDRRRCAMERNAASLFLCLWRSIFGGDSAFVLVEEVETMGISIG